MQVSSSCRCFVVFTSRRSRYVEPVCQRRESRAMRINSELVKKLRAQRHWSQEQLAIACGVNLRTIQRIERQGAGSLESVRALASVFDVDANDLLNHAGQKNNVQLEIVRSCLFRYADFSGTAARPEYWWFFLFVLLVTAAAAVIHRIPAAVVLLVMLLPLLAVGTRRLRDAGRSGWWQLMFLVPFGCVVVFWLLAEPGRRTAPELEPA